MRRQLQEIGRVWRLLNAPCKDMSALISQALDAELPFWERFAYKLHLLYCKACRRYRKHVHWLRTALRETRRRLEDTADPPPGAGLSAEARTRIQTRLRDTR